MEVERERLKLRDDPKVISPPSVDPAWRCGTALAIRGYIANAKLDVELDGAIVVGGFPGGFPVPNGALVPLPAPLVIRDWSMTASRPRCSSIACARSERCRSW
jgi:hypothetical protein